MKSTNKTKGKTAGLVILFAALAVVLFLLIANLFNLQELPTKITCAISLAMCLCALFYGVYGYKIPHGNLIRYLLLAFAAATASEFLLNPGMQKPMAICILLVVILSAYMAGRLGKNTECKILIALVGALLVAVWALQRFTQPPMMDMMPELPEMGMELVEERVDWLKDIFPADISRFLTWIALGVAYLFRFDEHKMLGMEHAK